MKSTADHHPPMQSRRLSDVATGETVRLTRVDAGVGLQNRLLAMGLAPGIELRVIRSGGWGPCIVGVNEGRIVLGRGMADKIEVE